MRSAQQSAPAPGRRVASRPVRRRGAVTALLPLVLGGLAWVGGEVAPEPAAPTGPEAVRAPLDTVALLCPPSGDGRAVAVAVTRVAVSTGQPGAATVEVGGPAGPEDSLELVAGMTELVERAGPVLVRGEGAAAPGLSADAAVDGSDGLAAGACVPPDTEWWFVGGGAGTAHRSELSVTNVDPGPAVVDVRLHGPEGPLDVEALRGVTLAPGETRTWAWAELVPGTSQVSAHVRATRGRVVAWSRDEGGGVDWPATAAAPGARQWVPAVPAGAGVATVSVTSTSTTTARATVRVVDATGAFVPLEGGELVVEPGAVATLDVTEAIGGRAVALEVSADADVVVGVRKVLRPARDQTAIPATEPLEGPGVVGTGPGPTVLHLVAGESGAVAEVVAFAAGGRQVGQERLTLGAGTMTTWQVPPDAAHLVVTPERGTPYAAAVRTGEDGGVAVVPVRPVPVDRVLPAVVAQSDS